MDIPVAYFKGQTNHTRLLHLLPYADALFLLKTKIKKHHCILQLQA